MGPGDEGRGLQYVQSASFDGKPQDKVWLDWSALRQGGTLRFALDKTPAVGGWGTKAEALPVSACASPK